MDSFKYKVVIVKGVDAGIGRAAVLRFAELLAGIVSAVRLLLKPGDEFLSQSGDL